MGKNTKQILEDVLEPNFHVFEVGSNIGAHTFQIAKQLTHGKVYAFEPTQYAFTKLSRNQSLNKFDNIDLNNIALSNYEKSKIIKRNIDPSSLMINEMIRHCFFEVSESKKYRINKNQ